MERVGAKEGDEVDREKYFRAVVTPNREKPKEEEVTTLCRVLFVCCYVIFNIENACAELLILYTFGTFSNKQRAF